MSHNAPSSSDDVPNQNSHSFFKPNNKARVKQEVNRIPPLFSEYTCSIHEPPVAFPRDVRGIQDLYYGSERAVIQARSRAAANPTNISKEDYKHFIHEIYTQVSQSQEQAERFIFSKPNRSLSTSIYEPPVFKFPPGYVRKLPTKTSHPASQNRNNVSSSSLVSGSDPQQLRTANRVVQNSQSSRLQNKESIPACERDYLSYLPGFNASPPNGPSPFPVPIKQEVVSIDLDSDSEPEKENLPIEIDLLSSDDDNVYDHSSTELDFSKVTASQQQTSSEIASSSESEALSEDDELSSAIKSSSSMISSVNSEANSYEILQEDEPIDSEKNSSVALIQTARITTIHTNSTNLNDAESLYECSMYSPEAPLELPSDEEGGSCSVVSSNADSDEDSNDIENMSSPSVSHHPHTSSDDTESYSEETSVAEQMPEHLKNSEPIQTQSLAPSALLSTKASTEDLASIELETAVSSNIETELDDNDSISPNEQLYVGSGESLDVNVVSTTPSTAAHPISTSGHGEEEPSDLSIESEQLDSEASVESDQIQPSILSLELYPALQDEKDSDPVQTRSNSQIDPEPAWCEEKNQGLDQAQTTLDIGSEPIPYDGKGVVLVQAQPESITKLDSSHDSEDDANSDPRHSRVCTELDPPLRVNQNLDMVHEQSTLGTELDHALTIGVDDNSARAQPRLNDELDTASNEKEMIGLAQAQATLGDELDTAVYEKESVDLVQAPSKFSDEPDSDYGQDYNLGLVQVQPTLFTEAYSHPEAEDDRTLAHVEPTLDTESGSTSHENKGVDLVQVQPALNNERQSNLQEEDPNLIQSQLTVGAVTDSSYSNEFSRRGSDEINQPSRDASKSILDANAASQSTGSTTLNALHLDFEKSENPEGPTLHSEDRFTGVSMDVHLPISNRSVSSSPTHSLYSAEDREEQSTSSKVQFKDLNSSKSNQSKLPSVHSSNDEHSDNSDDESYFSGDDSYYSVQDETAAVPSGRRKSGVKRRRFKSYQEKIHQSRELTDLGPPPREVATPYLLRRTLPSHLAEQSPNRRLSASLGYTTSLTRANATPYILREPAEMSHIETNMTSHEAPASTPGTPTKPKSRRVSKRQRKW